MRFSYGLGFRFWGLGLRGFSFEGAFRVMKALYTGYVGLYRGYIGVISLGISELV